MTKFVVGLAFNADHTKVLMQLKKRGPKEIIGCLNGPGGKIERGENPNSAMRREFFEETFINSNQEDWYLFHFERHPSGTELYFYTSDSLDIFEAKTMTVLDGKPPEDNVIVELPSKEFRSRNMLGYLWMPCLDGISYSVQDYDAHVDVQSKQWGGMAYNMPYLIPMAQVYLENPQHRYLEG